jgi:hypothetical protein
MYRIASILSGPARSLQRRYGFGSMVSRLARACFLST